MGSKRFRTQRVWHNTLLVVWSIPFVLLPGIIVGASSGRFALLQGLGVLLVTGLLVALQRDRRKHCHYIMDSDRMGLVHNGQQRNVALVDIADASLIDRTAAREFLRSWMVKAGSQGKHGAEVRKAFMMYCTVDIGISSYTMGIGRSLIDRLPGAKSDLVLLRLKDGTPLLLSPLHSQELVESISRKKMMA